MAPSRTRSHRRMKIVVPTSFLFQVCRNFRMKRSAVDEKGGSISLPALGRFAGNRPPDGETDSS